MQNKKSKESELSINGKEYNFNSFFNLAPDLLCIANLDGMFLKLNNEWEKALGYKISELEGRNFFDFIHPDDIKPTIEAVQRLSDKQEIKNFINRYKCKDGSYRWIEWRSKGNEEDKLIYAAARDITSRINYEEKLTEINSFNSKIFSNSPVGIATYDENGNCESYNNSFSLIMGCSKNELYVNKCGTIQSLNSPEIIQLAEEVLKNDSPIEKEIIIKSYSGKTKWIKSNFVSFSSHHKKHILLMIQDITESKTSEKLIQESERRFRELLGNIKLLSVILDPNGNIVYLNDHACDILGCTADEAIGKNWFLAFIPENSMLEDIKNSYSPNDVPMNRDSFILAKNGIKKLIRWTNTVLKDVDGNLTGTASLGEDITDKKIFEEFLEFRYKLINIANSNNLDEVLQLTIDTAERITESKIGFLHFIDKEEKTIQLQAWSTSTKQHFCKAEGKGSHYPVYIAGIWADCLRQRKPIFHNDFEKLENRKGFPEGHAPVYRELVIPIFQNDKIVSIIGVGNKAEDYNQSDLEKISYLADSAWNIIYSKGVEESLRKSESSLKELISTKDKFFSIIAHDLKSPFLGMLGYSNMIADEFDNLDDDHKKQFINSFNTLANNTYKLLTNLLEWSQLQGGRMEVVPSSLNLKNKISFAVDMLNDQAAQKNIRIIDHVSPNLNVEADQNMLETIIRNLISNSIKFSYPNGNILINAMETDGTVEISIKDFGVGMDDDKKENLFRIDKSKSSRGTNNETGTGLGLILCKEMIVLNKGKIWVDSAELKGTTVYFTLPAAKAEI